MRKMMILLAAIAFGNIASIARAADGKEVEIGYMPILPVSQLFVGLEEGWIEGAGIKPKLVQFQNGPAMVQALLAGQLDIAYFGIGPAMVARAKGVDIKVVASNIVEQISFIALGELAPYFKNGDAATAFARFAADKGRKPVISTFPVGSVPQTVLEFWLRKGIGANPDDLEIVFQGAAQVQQSLLTNAVDGAAILEPVVSNVLDKRDDAVVIARGSELFPNQPGAVLVVREGLIASDPNLVTALVAVHDRATVKLNEEPEEAVSAVQKYVGGGRLAAEIVLAALKNSRGSFVADPKRITDGTKVMHDFQAELGTLKKSVDLEALFDTSFYTGAGG